MSAPYISLEEHSFSNSTENMDHVKKLYRLFKQLYKLFWNKILLQINNVGIIHTIRRTFLFEFYRKHGPLKETVFEVVVPQQRIWTLFSGFQSKIILQIAYVRSLPVELSSLGTKMSFPVSPYEINIGKCSSFDFPVLKASNSLTSNVRSLHPVPRFGNPFLHFPPFVPFFSSNYLN